MMSSPGNSPAKVKNSAQVPITGIDRMTVNEPKASARQQVVRQ